jgi:hypothetical protein
MRWSFPQRRSPHERHPSEIDVCAARPDTARRPPLRHRRPTIPIGDPASAPAKPPGGDHASLDQTNVVFKPNNQFIIVIHVHTEQSD